MTTPDRPDSADRLAAPQPAARSTSAARVRITLLTRPGCHLCDVAKQALDRVTAATGEAWREVDVTGSTELEREYGDRLPVVLLDGAEHGYWRVEERRLLRDLGHPPTPSG
jgi:glutaredoxin